MATKAKSKGQKPSKVVKPKRSLKKSTLSTQNHRFKSFAERIANSKIDPIRRRRRADERESLQEVTATYFGTHLEQWIDLNQSSTFTTFAKQAKPLCDSLPMVIYNEERLMDLLIAGIEKDDALAAEPLLSLLSHFAHDLDSRFETHFPRAVQVVAAAAARHADPAVVEWSFNCLAWLFKYLSRLLVPDLRPLYELMAPYLGKQTQRPFIIRFAAESMSFLIRKAAARYETNPTMLDSIVKYILEDCSAASSSATDDLYQQGVMTLLTESIRGNQNDINSGGAFVLRSLIDHISKRSDLNLAVDLKIMTGVVTNLIHHTDSQTFRPLQNEIVGFLERIADSSTLECKSSMHLIFTLASVRKGTRVTDWRSLVKHLETLVNRMENSINLRSADRTSVLRAIAVVYQTAPVDVVIQGLHVLSILRSKTWQGDFLRFCDLFARLGRDRFDNFLLPQFQIFLRESDLHDKDDLLHHVRVLGSPSREKQFDCKEDLQDAVVANLASLMRHHETVTRAQIASASTALEALPCLSIKPSVRKKVQDILLSMTKQTLAKADQVYTDFDNFALGAGLASVLDNPDEGIFTPELWSSLCSIRSLALEKFVGNLLSYLKQSPPSQIDLEGPHMQAFGHSLVRCLSMPSHSVRQAALEILQLIYRLRDGDVPAVLEAAVLLESIPVTPDNARSIAMNIRRLASAYSQVQNDELLGAAIATYCFGLLHLQLSQAWDDAIQALIEVSKYPAGDKVVTNTTQAWLDGLDTGPLDEGLRFPETVLDNDSQGFKVVSDFECPNLAKLTAISSQVFEDSTSGYLPPEQRFLVEHTVVPVLSPVARERALMVLKKIPAIAEKRSRMLVPILLRWAGKSNEDIRSPEEKPTASRWNRKDQKAMLDVFAQFTNPRVLYKSDEVYDALLNLCLNGDAEIQRSALKAILTWKDTAITRYEEHLTNLLDEDRVREEISIFVQDTEEGHERRIEPEHRAKLMPVLLRLLYGRAVAGGKHGQGSRRKAIFVALASHDEEVLGMFIDIALTLPDSFRLESFLDGPTVASLATPLRQQLGVLNMMEDMLDVLGSQVQPFGLKILTTAILYSVMASRQLNDITSGDDVADASLLRAVRQSGSQCVAKAFFAFKNISLSVPANIAVAELVQGRLANFAVENTEAISATLRLLAALASTRDLQIHLFALDGTVIQALCHLLESPNAKDEVRTFILQDILDKLLENSDGTLSMQPHVTGFVQSIGHVLGFGPSKQVLDACVTSFSLLSTHIDDVEQAQQVINVCSELLTRPSKNVSNNTKTGLLRTISPLLERFDAPGESSLYDAACGLFSRLQGHQSRTLLSIVFAQLCRHDPALAKSAQICHDLNATGAGLDEQDNAKRDAAFAQIYEQHEEISLRQWQGIIHNCMFYVRDSEDLVNRTSASRALERFIDAAANSAEDFKPLIASTVLPGIAYGVKSTSELVRAEYLRILGHLVQGFPGWAAVKDMSTLSAQGDEEASFFTNVLHIQQHRRLRALRRLSDDATTISSTHVTQLFVPLLDHFVFEPAEGDAGRTLADQTITTLGALFGAMSWAAFRATSKRYIALLGSETHEKVALRLISLLVDAMELHFVKNDDPSGEDADKQALQDTHAIIGNGEALTPIERGDKPTLIASKASAAAVSLQRSETVARELLTPLMEYLHHKDESTVDRRMPVAVSVVKVLLCLPGTQVSARLPAVLTDVCHVLRSRSQEARDQTRKTLGQVLSLLGPSYLGFILKELRSALQRGSQLHVLSFTVHTLLVNNVSKYEPGDLNECLPELVSIVMDDIFGATGQEKDAEEYRSAMREVKSSKSYDTMELLAKVTPVQYLGRLIHPLQALLQERLSSNVHKKISELLGRLRKGIDQNSAAHSRDMLVFCHEIARQLNIKPEEAQAALRQRQDKGRSKAASTSYTSEIVSFALTLLRQVLRRHDDLMTAANLAGFLPLINQALLDSQEEIQLSAVRLLSTIMKLPLAELETGAPVYVNEAVRLLKAAPNMTADSAKASLELITSILRDKRSAGLKERDLADALKLLKSDLDEPDRQGIIYKFLRAVLGRKTMVPEVYEILDETGKVMVTNADRNVRESARSVYLQFLLEYPQSKKRWKEQSATLVANLAYESPAGRQSVMEVLHQLLSKISDELFFGLAGTKLFAALVLVQNTDVNTSCRDMAGLLLAQMFRRSDEERINEWLELVDKWMQKDTDVNLQTAALQCWSVLLRAQTPTVKRLEGLRDDIEGVLGNDESDDDATDDRLSETALSTLATLVDVTPDIAFASASQGVWQKLDRFVVHPQIEVCGIAAKLLGAFFTNVATTSSKTPAGLAARPLKSSGGLQLTAEDMHAKCSSCLRALFLDSPKTSEELISQTVRNIVFLGRCFAANGMKRRKVDQFGVDENPVDEATLDDEKDFTAFGHLFSHLSYIIRQENMHSTGRKAAIDSQIALISATHKVPNVPGVLRPLYSLTDPSVPNTDVTLTDKARSLMDLVQKEVGNDRFIKTLAKVRADATGRRQERRQKRRLEAVSAPGKRRRT